MSETPTPTPPEPIPLNYQSFPIQLKFHNITAAAWFSLLFSPAFGAILAAQNWKALGHPKKARHNLIFASLVILFFLVAPPLTLFVPGADAWFDKLPNVTALILLLTWYYALAKPQKDIILKHFGPKYPRKSWFLPLLIAVGACALYLIYVVSLSALAAVLNP